MEKLNVAIADDNERMVQLLDEIVASDKDLQEVGTAKNGVEAYEIIKHKQPDVVLLDIVMPKLDGLALLESTGGIVQGMSGSPVIQNGRLIGAVTHVFVDDAKKGYGIFIEDMLEIEKTSNP